MGFVKKAPQLQDYMETIWMTLKDKTEEQSVHTTSSKTLQRQHVCILTSYDKISKGFHQLLQDGGQCHTFKLTS
jgi:hypothetical protein